MKDIIRFTNLADGSTTADCFPEKICVVDCADPLIFRRDGDRLYITVANGYAAYVLTGEDAPRCLSWWTRLYATIEERE